MFLRQGTTDVEQIRLKASYALPAACNTVENVCPERIFLDLIHPSMHPCMHRFVHNSRSNSSSNNGINGNNSNHLVGPSSKSNEGNDIKQ